MNDIRSSIIQIFLDVYIYMTKNCGCIRQVIHDCIRQLQVL